MFGNQPDMIREHDKSVVRDTAFVVTNHLFGELLYSWWIIEVPRYQPEDIQGPLMDDIRATIYGPYTTKPLANAALKEFKESL